MRAGPTLYRINGKFVSAAEKTILLFCRNHLRRGVGMRLCGANR